MKPVKCSEHHVVLTCPSCVARERGRKGGKSRAKKLTADEKSAIGKMGGRPVTKPLDESVNA